MTRKSLRGRDTISKNWPEKENCRFPPPSGDDMRELRCGLARGKEGSRSNNYEEFFGKERREGGDNPRARCYRSLPHQFQQMEKRKKNCGKWKHHRYISRETFLCLHVVLWFDTRGQNRTNGKKTEGEATTHLFRYFSPPLEGKQLAYLRHIPASEEIIRAPGGSRVK